MPGKLSTLQASIAAMLEETTEIVDWGLSVISNRKGSIQSQIDAAMAGLVPSVIVYPPAARASKSNAQGPLLDRVSITLRIDIWPENYTAATAADIAELVLRRLHHSVHDVTDTDPAQQAQLLAEDGAPAILPVDESDYDSIYVQLFCANLGLAKYEAPSP